MLVKIDENKKIIILSIKTPTIQQSKLIYSFLLLQSNLDFFSNLFLSVFDLNDHLFLVSPLCNVRLYKSSYFLIRK